MRTVWTGVVTTATRSPALVPCPRVCNVRSARQTNATRESTTTPRRFTRWDLEATPLRRNRHLLQQVHLVEDPSGAERHARERVLTHRHRQVRFLTQQV